MLNLNKKIDNPTHTPPNSSTGGVVGEILVNSLWKNIFQGDKIILENLLMNTPQDVLITIMDYIRVEKAMEPWVIKFISDTFVELPEDLMNKVYSESLHVRTKYDISNIPQDSLDEMVRIIKESSRNLYNHDISRV